MSAFEYRISAITQIIGMALNNSIYIVFWLFFFEYFTSVASWKMNDIFLIISIVSSSYGLSGLLFGNSRRLSSIIAEGRLDYFLSFPAPVLTHVLISRCVLSGLGDLCFGVICFTFSEAFSPLGYAYYCASVVFVSLFYIAYNVIINSLTFWIGDAQLASNQVNLALISVAFYPVAIFSKGTRFILYTILPAGIISSIPHEIISQRDLGQLGVLVGISLLACLLAGKIFNFGLKKYASGSMVTTVV